MVGGGTGGKSLAKRVQSSSGSQQSSNIMRAKLAVQDGQYSKAIKALTSDGLATPSAEVLEEMLGKHPQVAPPNLRSGQVSPQFTVSELAVKKGVRSFPNGSAPGSSGLRPSHLHEAVGCPSPDRANRFLSSLTSFLNLLAGGRAPPTITPHLCGASPCLQEEEWWPSPHCRRGGAATAGVEVPRLRCAFIRHLSAHPSTAWGECPGRLRSHRACYLPADDFGAGQPALDHPP